MAGEEESRKPGNKVRGEGGGQQVGIWDHDLFRVYTLLPLFMME